jgi:hypothetical protein
MLKKCFHNHYFYQTNPKPQLKPKINIRRQPEKTPAHTKLLLQQPIQNPKAEGQEAKNKLFHFASSTASFFSNRCS